MTLQNIFSNLQFNITHNIFIETIYRILDESKIYLFQNLLSEQRFRSTLVLIKYNNSSSFNGWYDSYLCNSSSFYWLLYCPLSRFVTNSPIATLFHELLLINLLNLYLADKRLATNCSSLLWFHFSTLTDWGETIYFAWFFLFFIVFNKLVNSSMIYRVSGFLYNRSCIVSLPRILL